MERKPRAITISSYEDIDSIVTTELKIPDVPENYVLIRTEFASLNPADELIHDPKWPFKFEQSTFGFQGSGTVVLSGGGVLANSLVNKRVAFIVYGPHSIGSFSEYSLTQAKYVFPIGDAFSLEQAAIFFNAVMTELMVTKILKQNHKAAIQNAAASSVGKQLIRYCKYLGITLINIVSREDQIEILKAMGAKHVISTSEENWKTKVKELSQKLRATIGFDAVAGEMTGDMYDLLEQNSTLYLYGALSNKPITIDTSILEETKKLKSLEILDWLDSMSVLKRYHVMRKIQKLYTKIFIVTYCVSVDFQGFKEALVAYRERKTNSKILLRIANYYN